jgi:cation diffusion facilitator family transporter
MHLTSGGQESTTFAMAAYDDASDRRQADRAVGFSAVGLAVAGFAELALALLSGSVALLGDALHNLSDVSTSALVFVGFRASRKAANDRYTYGYERTEDLAGVGIVVVIVASGIFAALESVDKLVRHGATHHVGWGIAGAAIGIAGNQVVARYKLRVGRRINSGTLLADARHSWLDALSSAGALVGLIGVASGLRWMDAVAGLVITGFIAHVAWEVGVDVSRRLLDAVDPELVATATAAASTVPGVRHAHVRARWTGRTLRLEVEGWVDADTTIADSDELGRGVANALTAAVPEMRALCWAARSLPPA